MMFRVSFQDSGRALAHALVRFHDKAIIIVVLIVVYVFGLIYYIKQNKIYIGLKGELHEIEAL